MSGKFQLPALDYAFDSLEPFIDAKTMEIHHDKHHATYVDNLNKALEAFPDLQKKTIRELLSDLESIPEDIRVKVRNNGGGHANHTFFWKLLSRGEDKPSDELLAHIKRDFESLESFKEKFAEAALARFGSGWVWLILDGETLKITSTANQDTPWMEDKSAVLGLDVWEHAYYLKYQNKRADYVTAWWNILDWTRASENYSKAK